MNNLMLVLSIIVRLNASSESKGAKVSAFVNPRDSVNFLIASGVIPRRNRAASVGNLGSSSDETLPFSINGLMILFETGMPLNSNLENSIILGFLMFSASSIA